jgi:hypothetical protein
LSHSTNLSLFFFFVVGFFDIGSYELFAPAGLEPQFSWVARITCVSHIGLSSLTAGFVLSEFSSTVRIWGGGRMVMDSNCPHSASSIPQPARAKSLSSPTRKILEKDPNWPLLDHVIFLDNWSELCYHQKGLWVEYEK